MRYRIITTIIVVALFMVLVVGENAQAAVWTTVDFPGATATTATGIDGGNIVGTYTDVSYYPHGFLHDGTNWTTLDFPPPPYSPVAFTTPLDIDGGNIVGDYEVILTGFHGFLYDGTNWTTIAPPWAEWSKARAIDGGNIVGYYGDETYPAYTDDFLYDGTNWFNLSIPIPGTTVTDPRGIDGSNIVGFYRDSAGVSHSYLYDGTNLTLLDFPGAIGTWANGIDGTNIVGTYEDASGYHGFLYDGTSWTTLDFPGATGTWANGIDGINIVGSYEEASGADHGFLLVINEPPVADAGDDQTVQQSSHAGAEVTLDGSGSTDPDSTPGTNDDIVSFDWYEGTTYLATGETISCTFPLGSHTVTLRVTDSFGETDEDEVIITVEDTMPPEVACSVNPDVLWPPNHWMVPVVVCIEALDLCTETHLLEVSVTVASNEPDDHLGDGAFTGDVDGQDGYTNPIPVLCEYDEEAGCFVSSFALRAERAGIGEGRIYTIEAVCVDASGNTTTETADVTVPHD